jgi:hypothetical protein
MDDSLTERERDALEHRKQRVDQKFSLTVSTTSLATAIFHNEGFNAKTDEGGFTLEHLWSQWWNKPALYNHTELIAACNDSGKKAMARRIIGLAAQVRNWELEFEPEKFHDFIRSKSVGELTYIESSLNLSPIEMSRLTA